MFRSLNFNTCVSCVLSAGLILWPCHCTSIESYYCQPISLEELGLESLGLDKPYKKIMQPLKDLKPSDGRQKMARTAVKFLCDLNALTGLRLSIDDGITHAAAAYYQNGHPQTDRKVAAFRNLLNSQNSLSVEEYDENFCYDLKKNGKKEFGNIDDMTDNEIWSWCYVFGGCLLMMIPNGLCQALGAGMVTTGIYGVGQAGCKDEEDKKKH